MASTQVATGTAVPRKKQTNFTRTLKQILRSWQLYAMLLPAVVWYIIFCYAPMYGVVVAFKDFSMRAGILGSDWCGFENFQVLFENVWFPIILKNTLTLSILSLVLTFPLPIILALSFNELQHDRVRHFVQTVGYAPHFISTVVLCGMVFLFTNPTTGIINQFITMFGGEPIEFMVKPNLFKWVYIISGVWQGVGWSSIIYFAALAGVDKSLLEAAQIDGATRLQRIIHINFPVLVPTMMTLLILQCGQLLNVGYEKVYALQKDITLSASEVISTFVYKIGLQSGDFEIATAAGLFNSVCNTIILILANTLSKKLTESGLW